MDHWQADDLVMCMSASTMQIRYLPSAYFHHEQGRSKTLTGKRGGRWGMSMNRADDLGLCMSDSAIPSHHL